MRLPRVLLLPVIVFFALTLVSTTPRSSTSATQNKEFKARLQEIFDTRARSIITGADLAPALSVYDTDSRHGRWALSHEKNKLSFVQSWAQKRGIRITEAQSTLDIPWSRIRGDKAEFQVNHTLLLGYVYPGEKTINRFGIGTRHYIQLVQKNNRWLIRRDFYTDGLGDDTLVPNPTPAKGKAFLTPASTRTAKAAGPIRQANSASDSYDRRGAAFYADKFAGLAWGAGNSHRYNPRYRDLNGNGGDCTNFVSQALGDREGGKLPMDGTWYYRYDHRGGSGSRAWVQTESFASWLIYNGRAERLARGTFNELNEPDKKYPCGAVRELQPGDVIGYEEKGHIEHFAIVTGKDNHGYPLVNAHTVDRYHCPWDMGWDKKTIYHLFHIKH